MEHCTICAGTLVCPSVMHAAHCEHGFPTGLPGCVRCTPPTLNSTLRVLSEHCDEATFAALRVGDLVLVGMRDELNDSRSNWYALGEVLAFENADVRVRLREGMVNGRTNPDVRVARKHVRGVVRS